METKQQKEAGKRKIIKDIDKKSMIELYKNGFSHKEIANHFEIGRSTVTKILKTECLYNPKGLIEVREERKLLIDTRVNKLEEMIIYLYCERTVLGNDIEHMVKEGLDQDKLISAAKSLAPQFGLINFKGTRNWFNKLRRKHNIVFQTKDEESIQTSSNLSNNTMNNAIPDSDTLYLQSQLFPTTFDNRIYTYQNSQNIYQRFTTAISNPTGINQSSNTYDSNEHNIYQNNNVRLDSQLQDYQFPSHSQSNFHF